MRIIVTTLQDFVNSEIAEHGFDWVDAQFILGYEPTLVNGVWLWKDISPDIPIRGNSSTSTSTGSLSSGATNGADAATPLGSLR